MVKKQGLIRTEIYGRTVLLKTNEPKWKNEGNRKLNIDC